MERNFPGFEKVKETVARAAKALTNRLAPRPKYILEVSDEFNSLMAGIALERGIKKEDVMRNAVASYAYLQKELHLQSGEKRHLVVRDGPKILQRIELP